mmetsp:Transcript_7658/g.23995  ORF Transcript_7658/g.23995 Transcript_7658/m.23995 type:complete len:322 (-) Transcript_7658:275-1240(-)
MCENMWLRHETRSFHAGSSSQTLGSRSRHVTRIEFRSGTWLFRCAVLSSSSICADSCSSWNCWNICSRCVCDESETGGSEHHWASAIWMPSLQRPSASASLPSWMAAYVCSILSAACERMSHRRKRSRSRSQSADFHAHSISSAGCDPGHAFAYSERSSHWLSAFAERTMPSSHSASSGCGVLTSVISPACHRLMHSAYASCAACHAPYCSSARARRVSACSARCLHTAACPSRSPSALCSEASASYHAGSVGASEIDCCSSGIARCHALCRAPSERSVAAGSRGAGEQAQSAASHAWTTLGEWPAVLLCEGRCSVERSGE